MKERLTLVFLVLLRMAIGWHFAFEAIEKHRSVNIGETVTNKPWTSEPYFREGTGPIAKLVKSQIGDTDDLLLSRLTLREPASPGEPVSRQLPSRLELDWDAYLNRFIAHYGLDAGMQEKARAVLQEEKVNTVAWLAARPGSVRWLLTGQWKDHDRTPFTRTYPNGTYEVNISIAERVDEYRESINDYRSQSDKMFALGKDVEKARRPAQRAEIGALRSELQGLLDKRTEGMQRSLADAVLTKEQLKEKGPVPAAPRHWLIRLIDFSTMWGLLIIGAGLLLGLFTRTAALGGALFLIMTLLTHPPLPWLPMPPNTEGNYVFISKNVIELLALLLLACIPSGRWFGLDALIHAINPWRSKEEA